MNGVVDSEYWGEEFDGVQTDSVLLSLVQSYDWAATLARIDSCPHECKAIGVQGRTPLHVACDHDAPAVVIEALLRAYPEASLQVGTTDMNPLHITCSSQHASVHVVRVLLEGGHSLQSCMRDVDGDTPLHAACRCGAPIDVIELLLQANPRMVNERDLEGLTPLLRLWVRYFVILGDDLINTVRGPADLTGELGEAWRKTELLLKCAHYGSVDDHYISDTMIALAGVYHGFRAIHAASSVDCPRPVLKIATIIYGNQLTERDEFSMTPLLLAAKAPIFRVRDLSDEGYSLEDRIHGDAASEELANDSEQDAAQPSVIEILLQANRFTASIADLTGRLPLHYAIESGKSWNEGVSAILNAYPEALWTMDPLTRLYPFMIAAIGDKSDYGTILELLRRDPSLIGRNKT